MDEQLPVQIKGIVFDGRGTNICDKESSGWLSVMTYGLKQGLTYNLKKIGI